MTGIIADLSKSDKAEANSALISGTHLHILQTICELTACREQVCCLRSFLTARTSRNKLL